MIEFAITVIAIAAYIASSSIAYVLVPEKWDDNDNDGRMTAAALWPLVLACAVIYQLAMIGPRWAARRRLPKATAREVSK